MNVLVVDVGGTHVKILATGQHEPVKFLSGPKLTAKQMVAGVRKLARGWHYDVVSIGYPGPVLRNHPVAEPHNLGTGWVGFTSKKHSDALSSWSMMRQCKHSEVTSAGKCSFSAWGPDWDRRWW